MKMHLQSLGFIEWGVGQCRGVFGARQYQPELGLVLQLVEAREHPPGVIQPEVSGHVSAARENFHSSCGNWKNIIRLSLEDLSDVDDIFHANLLTAFDPRRRCSCS